MANPYSYTGPGTRWSEEDPTAEDYMNVSRANNDYLYEALTTIMDTDAADGIVTGSLEGDLGADAVFSPTITAVKTGENAKVGPIPIMLDDPDQMWNLPRFMQLVRNSSWYSSLGAPPIHGSWWIHEDTNSWTWWDIETDTEYVTVDGAINGIIEDATPVLTDGKHLDGKIYLSGTGGADLTIIDLLRDGATKHDTSGSYKYQGLLEDFTGTDGYLAMSTAASQQIANATVNAVAVCRDPEEVDEFGGPKHWWAAGTADEISAYSPVDDAIYDSGQSGSAVDQTCVDITPNGVLVSAANWAAAFGFRYDVYFSIFAIGADEFSQDSTWWNGASGSEDVPWTNAATPTDHRVIDGLSAAGEGGPLSVFGSDEGLIIGHMKPSAVTDGGIILITSTYNSPYQKGDIRAAWPLHAVTDVSVKGHNLTNNNAVTFVAGGPCGHYANFVAASSQSLSLADHADFDDMSALTISFWLYREIDSGGDEGLVSKYDIADDPADASYLFYITAADMIRLNLKDAAHNQATLLFPVAISLNTWYHVVATYDGSDSILYVNGVVVDSDAALSGAVNGSTEILTIAARTSGDTPQDFFDGRIAGVSICAEAWSEREVQYEYRRGIAGLNASSMLLTATDVDSIRVDPNSGLFIVTAGDVAHIMDEYGTIIATDAAPVGTLRDASLYSREGADTPFIFLGDSAGVEIVAPDVRLQDRA